MSRILDISSKLSRLYFLLIVDIYVVYHITNLWATTLILMQKFGINNLENDVVAGRLDVLADEAIHDLQAGRCTEL
ncbi:hypothetical protein TI05_16580 [Achromatium sp. WMS3]|nr:hypothetical protein TI05_16580 [Achromatium sp. WMS3]